MFFSFQQSFARTDFYFNPGKLTFAENHYIKLSSIDLEWFFDSGFSLGMTFFGILQDQTWATFNNGNDDTISVRAGVDMSLWDMRIGYYPISYAFHPKGKFSLGVGAEYHWFFVAGIDKTNISLNSQSYDYYEGAIDYDQVRSIFLDAYVTMHVYVFESFLLQLKWGYTNNIRTFEPSDENNYYDTDEVTINSTFNKISLDVSYSILID